IVERGDRRAADPLAGRDRPHLRAHQAHPPGDPAHRLVQVGDAEDRRAGDQRRIGLGDAVVDHGFHGRHGLTSGLSKGAGWDPARTVSMTSATANAIPFMLASVTPATWGPSTTFCRA